MSRKADWLIYAAETKAEIDKLHENQKTRDHLLFDSYFIAKGPHHYPGTLAEWEFVVESASIPPHAAHPRGHRVAE